VARLGRLFRYRETTKFNAKRIACGAFVRSCNVWFTRAMKDLVDQLVKQAELNPEQAAKVAEVVKNFLADKLPEPIRGPVLGALSGENISAAADQAKGFLGNIAGKLF
jgi:hypothetical protein